MPKKTGDEERSSGHPGQFTLLGSESFKTYVEAQGTLADFQIDRPGLYVLDYEHPGPMPQPKPGEPRARVLVTRRLIAVLPLSRLRELGEWRRQEPAVEQASRMFRRAWDLEFGEHYGNRVRAFKTIHEHGAIKKGMPRDKIMFLLGSPPGFHHVKPDTGRPYDESWSYGLGPNDGLWIKFLDGEVFEHRYDFDGRVRCVRIGHTPDWVLYLCGGEPREKTQWREPQPGGYDEVWTYAPGSRVMFKDGVVVKTESPPLP